MKIVVCIKRVPEAAEAILRIDASGKKLVEDTLTFGINETDNYALEEALLVKERLGGTVTLVTVGPEAADEVLRMGLAKGADDGLRITPPEGEELDPFATACLLAREIPPLAPDLVLTGCVAADDGSAQVGVSLAELLHMPHLSLVVAMEVGADGQVLARRELEGGLQGEFTLHLPALFTVQSGINQPRYASILGIKRASAKPIKVVQSSAADSVMWETRALAFPTAEKKAEILHGTPNEVAEQLVSLLKGRALL
ncbi:MAG: electron transfer flavoprotein subunit beta/FixA family protein [bacterium]|jgi:electron transfer flavoprotein beta subunit|nr:electron transfer flavoprotein subunit beta/FixA family protein [candidate division KSB1 bacterium]MDH7559219.1 electron transfer flavoprotein subunit beta/FixA family protein [bacterium]